MLDCKYEGKRLANVYVGKTRVLGFREIFRIPEGRECGFPNRCGRTMHTVRRVHARNQHLDPED